MPVLYYIGRGSVLINRLGQIYFHKFYKDNEFKLGNHFFPTISSDFKNYFKKFKS